MNTAHSSSRDARLEEVPRPSRRVFAAIVELTDAFCHDHLGGEYRELCRDMAVVLCQKGSPVKRGRAASWASGIVHALGWVNFLFEPTQRPHVSSRQLAQAFGVSQGTMTAKSRIIREALGLIPMDPGWWLPSKVDENPLIWMVQSASGAILDIRRAPRDVQQQAYRMGLIPYVPDDRKPRA